MFDHSEKKSVNDTEMFNDIVNAILSVMGDDALKIILYGSVARGDNTWESDVDIAVLTTRYYDWGAKRKLYDELWEYDLKYDTIFSIVPIDEKYFNYWKKAMPFFMNIEKEGIVLWTREVA